MTLGLRRDFAAGATRLVYVASLHDPEVRDFLQQGTRTGKLSYLAASGRPLVAPIWFIVEDDSIIFNTGQDTAKGRSLARDPRVSLCVDLEEPPYAFVQVQGEAELSQDPAELLRTATAIAARYMGQERAAEYGKRNAVPGELIVRLRPAKVIAAFDVSGLGAPRPKPAGGRCGRSSASSMSAGRPTCGCSARARRRGW
jgi:PPOX class probable F420-dependent enzyme